MSDEQLNTAIDEVARRMTEGSPAGDAGFRRRVLARIDTSDAPRARWRPLFVVVPLAAALVIAVVVTRSRPGPFAPSAPTSTPMTAGPEGAALREAVVRPGPSGPGDHQAVRRPRPYRSGVSDGAPHLDPIDTIAVAPLRVDTLTPEAIQIPRLDAVVPIAVAPLDAIEEQRRYE